MKKAKVVVCTNCGATFRNRRFWTLPKNNSTPRNHCVRCWSKGPFEEAKKEDIEAFSNSLTRNMNIFGLLETITGLAIIVVTIFVLSLYL